MHLIFCLWLVVGPKQFSYNCFDIHSTPPAPQPAIVRPYQAPLPPPVFIVPAPAPVTKVAGKGG